MSLLLLGANQFNVKRDLFSNNEQGLWLDPSQMSMLYQDSNGVTPAIGRIWLLHEVMHYLGYRAVPPSDNFHHSRVTSEIYHAAGSGPEFGSHFLNWLRSRYGRA